MGALKDPDTGEARRSKLLGTKYLPSLEGTVWQARAAGDVGIDKSLQLFFRRHRMDFQILKHPSDPKTKFDLFQRLNRGGAYANEQEVRTCSMVLANPDFTRRLRAFADREDFKQVFHVTEDQTLKQGNLEYAVRLVALSYVDFPQGRDVQEFLDSAILEVMDKHPLRKVMERVEWTVAVLPGWAPKTPSCHPMSGIRRWRRGSLCGPSKASQSAFRGTWRRSKCSEVQTSLWRIGSPRSGRRRKLPL